MRVDTGFSGNQGLCAKFAKNSRACSICSDCVDRSGCNAAVLWGFGIVVEFSIPTAPTSFLSDSTELTKSARQQKAALRTELRRRLSISSRHGWHVDADSFTYLKCSTSRALHRRHPKHIGTCAESVCRVSNRQVCPAKHFTDNGDSSSNLLRRNGWFEMKWFCPSFR